MAILRLPMPRLSTHHRRAFSKPCFLRSFLGGVENPHGLKVNFSVYGSRGVGDFGLLRVVSLVHVEMGGVPDVDNGRQT